MMMSVTRCYACVQPFSDQSYTLTISILTALQLASLSISILPILPLTLVQDYVTTMVFFNNNPIVPKANVSLLSRILYNYTGVEQELTISELTRALANTTADQDVFSVSQSLGFYSESPLCINIFTTAGQTTVWKVLYIVLLGGVLVVVALSYIIIACTTLKTNNINNGEMTERAQFLSFKVTVIIISQFACWVPILVASGVSMFGVEINPTFYEVAAVIILPLNSITDPVLYTDILKNMFGFIRNRKRRVRRNEIEMSEYNGRETELCAVSSAVDVTSNTVQD